MQKRPRILMEIKKGKFLRKQGKISKKIKVLNPKHDHKLENMGFLRHLINHLLQKEETRLVSLLNFYTHVLS